MKALSILRGRPAVFFRLSGIRIEDFDALVRSLHPVWLSQEQKRLSGRKRRRAIGAGRTYHLGFESKLLLCLIYYRTYISHEFLGLLFGVSDSTRLSRTIKSALWPWGQHRRGADMTRRFMIRAVYKNRRMS
jgi:hypothetical protein